MISKYLQKKVDQLSIKDIEFGKLYAFVTFEDTESNLIVDYERGYVRCSCHNGSSVGVNNKQLCKHKIRFVKDLMEVIK
ncbi:MAG: hypothetical protein R3321_14410 [Nitrososphaeraceae archaeon]|nr:hypothetical protein [Nitrososphaeraceae archaeon]